MTTGIGTEADNERVRSSRSSRHRIGRAERSYATAALLDQVRLSTDAAERKLLLDHVIVLNMELADSVVARYTRRGVDVEDLRQVAYMALTQAADRFDQSVGAEFSSYAIATVRGEVRKYFRDHAWMVRPTRRIQEVQGEIGVANDELWQQLGRAPRAGELAARIRRPIEDVSEAVAASGCFVPSSLDQPPATGPQGSSLGDLLPTVDRLVEEAEARLVLAPLLRGLSERDRYILKLRFVDDLTQREIAAEIGVTQMQVSRLLSRIYRDLRGRIGDLENPDSRHGSQSARIKTVHADSAA